MAKKILGIAGSPRKNGNSERLLDALLEGAAEAGAEVEKVRVCKLDISPCIECGGCNKKGVCVIKDEMQDIYPKYIEADWVVFATPIFFMNVPAHLKAFIDRFQCLWAKKYVLEESIREGGARNKGLVLAVGGTKGKTLFDGTNQLFRVFFAIVDTEYDKDRSMFLRQVDNKGDIDKHPDVLEQARATGREIASAS